MIPSRFCGKEYKNGGVSSHELACKLNPEPDSRLNCSCVKCHLPLHKNNVKKHIEACIRLPKMVICPQCGVEFEESGSVTCSYSCGNIYFKDKQQQARKVSVYLLDEELISSGRYRTLCFRYHDKKCVVCGEDKIVEVHHYNNDHLDHCPKNLVPICPTHHKYLHSGHKYLIQDKIDIYVKDFINSGYGKAW